LNEHGLQILSILQKQLLNCLNFIQESMNQRLIKSVLSLGILVFSMSANAQFENEFQRQHRTDIGTTKGNGEKRVWYNFQLNAEEQRIFDTVQYRTFQYFWEGAEPNSGLAPERIHMDNHYPENDQHIVTTGGSGFGVMAITAGYYRGWISQAQYLARMEKIVSFLATCDRFHGAWPHWIDGKTGKVRPFSKYDDGGDLVESSFLMQGLLCVKSFLENNIQCEMPGKFKKGPVHLGKYQSNLLASKQSIINQIQRFWNEMEFDWYTNGQKVLFWHWSPNYGWKMNFGVRGYNECLIMYVLAASSPTHAISADVFHLGWADSGKIVAQKRPIYDKYSLKLRYQGYPPHGGPLFWAHYSYLALNPMGLSDRYCDYGFENFNLTMMNLRWCSDNPLKFKGYSDSSWGLTASYSVKFYAAHAPDSLNDVGVISPTAALSSYPYAPMWSTKAMVHWYKTKLELFGKYGFYDAFSEQENWMLPHYLAIDQGPIAVMMENYRSGLFWGLFMSNKDIQRGIAKLGMVAKPANVPWKLPTFKLPSSK
jgi:hypothetical protein